MKEPIIAENAELAEVIAYFKDDRFATDAAGCTIVEASRGHAVVHMPLRPVHYNAAGGVMGGAIFTLADYALAIASNVGEPPTVSVSNTVEFISAAKGDTLIAVCEADRSGSRLGFYSVAVTDDTGRLVAKMTATCARV